MDSGFFISPRSIDRVAKALVSVDRAVPALRGIRGPCGGIGLALYPPEADKRVFIDSSGVTVPPDASRLVWSTRVPRVGIHGIDSLNQAFGATEVIVEDAVGESNAYVRFARAPNIPVLAQAYERLPSVAHARPVASVGDSTWIMLIDKAESLLFAYELGSGDCASGCISWIFHYVAVDQTTGKVTLAGVDTVIAGAAADSLYMWDIPKTHTTRPLHAYADIARWSRDHRWWFRSYIAEAISALLGAPAPEWPRSPSSGDTARLALVDSVTAHRHEMVATLKRLQGDPDPMVAASARRALDRLRMPER